MPYDTDMRSKRGTWARLRHRRAALLLSFRPFPSPPAPRARPAPTSVGTSAPSFRPGDHRPVLAAFRSATSISIPLRDLTESAFRTDAQGSSALATASRSERAAGGVATPAPLSEIRSRSRPLGAWVAARHPLGAGRCPGLGPRPWACGPSPWPRERPGGGPPRGWVRPPPEGNGTPRCNDSDPRISVCHVKHRPQSGLRY